MKICVCGWYYYPGFYQSLKAIDKRYPVHVVCNRKSELVRELSHSDRCNTGLDWGAYNFYLENVWDGHDSVLFIQDDTDVGAASVFVQIDNIKNDSARDVVFLFNSPAEAAYNSNAHGRAFYCSARFLSGIKEEGNFPFDEGNRGFIAGGDYRSQKPPEGCRHHNFGIHSFLLQIDRVTHLRKYNRRSTMCFSQLYLGRRGKLFG